MGVRVTLSGADGSGKSTLAGLLAWYLAGFGSVGVHWLRGSHLLASVLLRVLRGFRVFRGSCNPYYGVCVPGRLRPLWVYVEFLSVLPHIIVRGVLARLHGFLVCDRGVADFIVWVVVTLDRPGFVSSLLGRFLVRLALRENIVYLHAAREVLSGRADLPESFIRRELAVYEALMPYLARCSIDTGRHRPTQALIELLRCMKGDLAGKG